MKDIAQQALNQRIWATPYGVGPARIPKYMALGKLGDPSQSQGDATRIPAPDPDNFNQDVTVGVVSGTEERGTITISKRYTAAQAELLAWYRNKCRIDLYALVGKCGNPQDFAQGGEKWVYFRDGRPSTISMENFGAFGKDESNPTNENLDMTFEQFWEFLKIGADQLASATTTRRIAAVAVCDSRACGECGRTSEGCERVFAVMIGTGATPGTQPQLLYSDDGGDTVNTQTIDTLYSTEAVEGAVCIQGDLVLISNEGNEIHFTDIDDLFIGENVWEEMDNGFVVGGEPNHIYSLGPNDTWIVGNGGYIYYTSNHRASVSVQDAGVATTQNLYCVHAYDRNNVLAVGNSNAVIVTENGGDTWETRTGPCPGINICTCWMLSEDVWIVGEGAGGNGVLYYTDDGGYTWNEIDLPVTNIGQFDRLVFVSEAEGYLTYRTGGNGGILRTITGGAIWWGVPDNNQDSLPANDYLTDLAVCEEDSNTYFAGGLADDGTAGMWIKGEGPLAD